MTTSLDAAINEDAIAVRHPAMGTRESATMRFIRQCDHDQLRAAGLRAVELLMTLPLPTPGGNDAVALLRFVWLDKALLTIHQRRLNWDVDDAVTLLDLALQQPPTLSRWWAQRFAVIVASTIEGQDQLSGRIELLVERAARAETTGGLVSGSADELRKHFPVLRPDIAGPALPGTDSWSQSVAANLPTGRFAAPYRELIAHLARCGRAPTLKWRRHLHELLTDHSRALLLTMTREIVRHDLGNIVGIHTAGQWDHRNIPIAIGAIWSTSITQPDETTIPLLEQIAQHCGTSRVGRYTRCQSIASAAIAALATSDDSRDDRVATLIRLKQNITNQALLKQIRRYLS